MHLNEHKETRPSRSLSEIEQYDSKEFQKKKWYRDELEKAIESTALIKYAYTNVSEFLAVTASGDTSKFSDEFKDILVKLGMPRFVFDLDK